MHERKKYEVKLEMTEEDKRMVFDLLYTRESYEVAEEPNASNEYGGLIRPHHKKEYREFIRRTLERIFEEMK